MSTPRINPNDPKWTAYVLGELDEADRASVERLLESSAEARALVNELKVSASAIDDALFVVSGFSRTLGESKK